MGTPPPHPFGYGYDPRQQWYGYYGYPPPPPPPPHAPGYTNHPPPRQYRMHQHHPHHMHQPHQNQQHTRPPPPQPPMHYDTRSAPSYPPPAAHHWRHQQSNLRNPRQATVRCECKPCGKTFVKESQLIAHNKTHIQCWDEGCEFSASKQVVNGHYAKMHGQYKGEGFKQIEVDGQKFTVLLGDSEEDIKKWRAERRKQWPTNENISTKKKVMDARIEAGDIIEQVEKKAKQQQKQAPSKREKKKGYCKRFLSNKCTYGDECDWSHDLTGIRCKIYYKSGRCPRGDTCKFKHDEVKPQKRKAEVAPENSRPDKKRSEFRQKLLRNEIQQEHSDILQAFRFFVSTSFLTQIHPAKTKN